MFHHTFYTTEAKQTQIKRRVQRQTGILILVTVPVFLWRNPTNKIRLRGRTLKGFCANSDDLLNVATFNNAENYILVSFIVRTCPFIIK